MTAVEPTVTDATSASAYLESLLRDYGLSDMLDWAKSELAAGYDDVVVLQHMRDQPQFRQRFKVIFDREAAGLPPISPGDVISYERSAAQLMGHFGLPSSFYDQPSDFHDLLLKDVSPQELQSRLESGYTRVQMAPPELRDAFREFFGVEGDSNLAAFFLDPERAQPILERQVEMAAISGVGRRYGFNPGYSISERLAQANISERDALGGFGQLADMAGLFHANAGEQQMDAGTTGVEAVFGLDQNAKKQVEQRTQTRTAAFAGQGGAAVTQEGVVGAGSSERR